MRQKCKINLVEDFVSLSIDVNALHYARAFGERTAANSPIQGSAADLIKIAMIRVRNRLAAEQLSGRMLLQVHDELVLEVPEAESASLAASVGIERADAATRSANISGSSAAPVLRWKSSASRRR